MSKIIAAFVNKLSQAHIRGWAHNPYTSTFQKNNLEHYLRALIDHKYSGNLLVGEAPGYLGCLKTGIPFTSERIINQSNHPFLLKLRPRISTAGDTAEATATIIWNEQADSGVLDAFWNIFPFHPHKKGTPRSNRAPNDGEITTGLQYLLDVLDILQPQRIVCVGKRAQQGCSKRILGINVETVPHPSYGKKAMYIEGMARIRHSPVD
ncbi:uracil-DNA glycosylase [Ruficoccus sp. ZRK36]|uniref:uracil-DNA glycosylase n=1 Tax=Ruficoccus sp. ZRK36 TaxID=2866311 RepID=UPI001C72EE2B|nr:uracil-DNA glycosylase [Ruficoccus sp. ZRK36]QYY34601.1 uracil-DNA glycosylase [Ruficoccus sp. ZRK36]